MTHIINIRGTNGSGKTTLARLFLPPNLRGDADGGPVDLSRYPSPTKRDPDRALHYPGYGRVADSVLVLGRYEVTCGGMDNHPAGKGFVWPLDAIRHALLRLSPRTIVCEGVLASGVYGSWHEFAEEVEAQGHQFSFVYLHTPALECLERIRVRQHAAGKTPAAPGTPDYDRMVENVIGKWVGTMRTREKALADGHQVFDLPLGLEAAAIQDIAGVCGEAYRARA